MFPSPFVSLTQLTKNMNQDKSTPNDGLIIAEKTK